MVKKIAFIAVFLCFAMVASAEMGMKFGARLGYSMQMISEGDYPEAPEAGMLGVGAGAVANMPLGPFVLAPELAFIYRTTSSKDKEKAISIPLIVKFYPIEVLFLQAGFQFDIIIGPEACVDDECAAIDGKSVNGIAGPERAAVDIGVPMGLGYMIMPELSVDLRYVLGLFPYSSTDVPVGSAKMRTGALSTFGLGATYFF